MRIGFYPKLAWTGIRKNKRLYIPYLLTCGGMVMMYYIISFLTTSEALNSVSGGAVMQTILKLGCGVIGVFAALFLFYTNSFLIRRRKKEFGLYNILGMGKRNLARLLFWESLIIAVLSLAAGLVFGIAFSKFTELGMINLLRGEVTFSMTVAAGSVVQTMSLFGVIFLLILINTLCQIHLSSPVELTRSEAAGEKPPKANWMVALAGAVILAAAYYLAVSIENPVSALVWFFAAVIMVIIATYMLFVAGSVAVCKILQKNRKYYYRTNHFVSVSSMVFRMKRNGAGLASICILCTMVLVMLSSTMCLYIGAEDVLRKRYPRNISVDISMDDLDTYESGETDVVKEIAAQAVSANGQAMENELDYPYAQLGGYILDNHIVIEDMEADGFQLSNYDDIWQLFILSVDDYNRLMDQSEALEPGEVLLYITKYSYPEDTIVFGQGEEMKVKKIVPEFISTSVDAVQIIPSMYIIVPDVRQFVEPYVGLTDSRGNRLIGLSRFYGFDLNCSDEAQNSILEQLQTGLRELSLTSEGERFHAQCEGVAKERTLFYSLYGGLFFLGILLGVVFIFAAVLIMYYKQVSEGYEDQSRFEIMQKVGMTDREIRQSINSQVLTVFFLPLLTAGVHLGFAFPMIYKMLVLFGLTDVRLLIMVTVGCYLVFGLFYVAVYRITSRAYYHIVSGARGR